jgi:hypothetical protein
VLIKLLKEAFTKAACGAGTKPEFSARHQRAERRCVTVAKTFVEFHITCRASMRWAVFTMPALETHVEGAGGDIAGGKLVLLDEATR